MKILSRTLIVAAVTALIVTASASLAVAAPTVLYSDEFNAGPLNTTKWKTVLPWGTQWNNRELQWYDPANLTFVNGGLRSKTEKRYVNGYQYASGIVTSRSQYSYGYFEFRAKLPKGQGVWPALWLLNDGTQEIDVMEMLGNQPTKVYMTYHRSGYGQVYQAQYTGPDFSAGYHTFGVDVQRTYIRWYIDGVKRGEYYTSVPSNTGNIIVNTAVGDSTSWPGAPNSTTVFPQYLDLDYVRLWSSMPAPGTYPPTQPPAGITFSRVAGADRYATAVAVSKRAFPNGAPAAVIAYGGNYPDALTAAPLAKAYGGPVLLTRTAALPSSVLAELQRLAPNKVFVVGSTLAVGSSVERQLASLPSQPSVTRLGGMDRYDTAGRIADAVRAKTGTPSRVVIANGYPDALSAAPLAAAKGWPILLTRRDSLPPYTVAAIARSGAGSSLVVGSATVVSDAVKNALPSPTRVGGQSRYDTNGALADFALSQGLSYARVAVATGADFPDGLVAAPYLANSSGLLLLTNTYDLPPAISTRISANKTVLKSLDAIGSATSVSDSVLYEAAAALQ